MTESDTAAFRRVTVITGGGAGIGRACALRAARQGDAVLIADRDADDGQATVRLIQEHGGEARFQRTDVAREADLHAMAQAALEAFGRIDALIANAGARVFSSILEATEEDWQRIVSVNLKGVADSCKAVLPTMIRQQAGAIVIVSSANALLGRDTMPLYDATKAGVLSLTRSLAVAHGKDQIRVNAVCPGFTVTDFHERRAAEDGLTPQQVRERAAGYALRGRPAEPDEIAAPILFLASDDAVNITGQSLMVDGGRSVT